MSSKAPKMNPQVEIDRDQYETLIRAHARYLHAKAVLDLISDSVTDVQDSNQFTTDGHALSVGSARGLVLAWRREDESALTLIAPGGSVSTVLHDPTSPPSKTESPVSPDSSKAPGSIPKETRPGPTE